MNRPSASNSTSSSADPAGAVDGGDAPSLDEIAHSLGPFAPPHCHPFESELSGPAPRCVPPECRRSPMGTRLRRNAVSLLLMGVVCLLATQLRPVMELSHYLLPLAYLSWIGAGLMLIGLAMLVSFLAMSGPPARVFKYVREGEPLVGRVLANRPYVKDAGNGLKRFGYETGVQLLHPETGRMENAWLRSNEIGSADKIAHFEAPFAVGDYVTVVHFPGRFTQSGQVYALLGVSPAAPFIRRDGRTWAPGVTFPFACAVTGAVVSGFGLLLSGIYAIQFRAPVTENDWQFLRPMIPAAIVLAPLCGCGLYLLLHRAGTGAGARAIFTFLGGIVFGVIGSFVLVAFVNSGLDRSAPEYREFEVVDLWEQTYSHVFRTYEVEYQPLGGGKGQKYPARHGEMDAFAETRAGVAEMHRGFLGLPWVRRLYPMQWELEEVGDAANAATRPEREFFTMEPAASTSSEEEGSPVVLSLELVVTLEDGKRLNASPELTQRVMAKLSTEGEEIAADDETPGTAPVR